MNYNTSKEQVNYMMTWEQFGF